MSTPNPDSSALPVQPVIPTVTASRPVQIQSLTPGSASSSVPVAPSIPSPVTPVAVVSPDVLLGHDAGQASHADYEPVVHVPIIAPKRTNVLVKYWNMIGGGSLMVSILIHAGLIALAIAIVVTTSREPKVDFLPGGGSKGSADASSQVAQQVQNKKRSALNKTTPMRKVVSQSQTATISLPDVPVEAIDMPEMSSLMGGSMGSGGFGKAGSGGGFGKGTGIGGQAGFTSLPPSMKSRCSMPERLQKLKEGGVPTTCESAVSKALEYLKTTQNPDGSFGLTNKAAMTGFALLCYLGRCETPDSPFYGDNVMKGILYLVELSNSNPHGMMAQNITDSGGTYEHGIATYALGEMYTLARLGSKTLPGMKEAFEKGVKLIIDNQGASGGWGYGGTSGIAYSKGGNDLSVTGWQYQALKAAKLSGLKIEGLHTAIDKAVKNLESKQTKDGGFGNANREGGYNQWNLTGTGALGLQTLGHGKSTQIKKGIKFAYDFHKKEPPDWKGANLYAWYYYAQMYFQNGGPEAKYWNETALPAILANQAKDGSWTHASAAQGGKKVYSTALCTLMLEVYYRYLKVGDKETGSMFDRK